MATRIGLHGGPRAALGLGYTQAGGSLFVTEVVAGRGQILDVVFDTNSIFSVSATEGRGETVNAAIPLPLVAAITEGQGFIFDVALSDSLIAIPVGGIGQIPNVQLQVLDGPVSGVVEGRGEIIGGAVAPVVQVLSTPTEGRSNVLDAALGLSFIAQPTEGRSETLGGLALIGTIFSALVTEGRGSPESTEIIRFGVRPTEGRGEAVPARIKRNRFSRKYGLSVRRG